MRIPAILALVALLGLSCPAQQPAERPPRAPDFKLKDTTGREHQLSRLKGIVVLEWTNKDCPYVQRHYKLGTMTDLAARYASKGVIWLSIDSTHHAAASAVERWRRERKIPYPILLDPSGDVGRAYGARTSPHMFIVKDGRILYQGAIDDAPRGKATVNYVEKALAEILAGKPVSVPRTRPYGCSVKYARKSPKNGNM